MAVRLLLLLLLELLAPPHGVETSPSYNEQPPPIPKEKLKSSLPEFCFAWGANADGQTGIFNGDEMVPVVRPASVQALVKQGVCQVAAGDKHSLALAQQGTVFAWGQNRNGQIGLNTTRLKFARTPVRVRGLSNMVISRIAAGGDFSLVLTMDNQLYGWGSNAHGQLGVGGDLSDRLAPQFITSNIAHVAAGRGHTLAVSVSGKVYTWGNNADGQLGLSIPVPLQEATMLKDVGLQYDHQDRQYPQQNTFLDNAQIIRLCGGKSHSVALGFNSAVWVWGDNEKGQLGILDGVDREKPTLNTNLNNLLVKAISCGAAYTLVLSQAGEIWGFGDNSHGQLGVYDAESTKGQPWPADMPENVTFASMTASDKHSISIASDGSLWGMGMNTKGQIGLGFAEPVDVKLLNPLQLGVAMKQVAAGGMHTIASTLGLQDCPTDPPIAEKPQPELRPAMPSPSPNAAVVTSPYQKQPLKANRKLIEVSSLEPLRHLKNFKYHGFDKLDDVPEDQDVASVGLRD